VVLHPTKHKIGHFGDISPSRSLGLVWKKLNLTQQKHAFTNEKKCTTTQYKTQKLKLGLVTFMPSGLEIAQVYSQRKDKEKNEEKDK